MALFFDAVWFDARLSERGLSREAMAVAAGLTTNELMLVFKDQREISAGQVAAFAELLDVQPAEIANRAGVSTPVPGEDRLSDLERQVAALEAEIARLKG